MNNLTVDSGQMVPIIRIISVLVIASAKKLNICQPNKSEGELTIDCSDCQERQTIKPDRHQLADIIKINHHYFHYYYHDSNHYYYHYYHYHYHVRPSSTATLTSLAW